MGLPGCIPPGVRGVQRHQERTQDEGPRRGRAPSGESAMRVATTTANNPTRFRTWARFRTWLLTRPGPGSRPGPEPGSQPGLGCGVGHGYRSGPGPGPPIRDSWPQLCDTCFVAFALPRRAAESKRAALRIKHAVSPQRGTPRKHAHPWSAQTRYVAPVARPPRQRRAQTWSNQVIHPCPGTSTPWAGCEAASSAD